jgi:hypothetical protein
MVEKQHFVGYACYSSSRCKSKFLRFETKEELARHKREAHGFVCEQCNQWVFGTSAGAKAKHVEKCTERIARRNAGGDGAEGGRKRRSGELAEQVGGADGGDFQPFIIKKRGRPSRKLGEGNVANLPKVPRGPRKSGQKSPTNINSLFIPLLFIPNISGLSLSKRYSSRRKK